jgi:hypothetical protein
MTASSAGAFVSGSAREYLEGIKALSPTFGAVRVLDIGLKRVCCRPHAARPHTAIRWVGL